MDRRPRIALALGISLVSLGLAASGTALGHSNGQTGASGKSSVTCNNCHQGGEPPKVTLTGPTQLEAGVPAIYTLRVETTNKLTGMNAASTDDVLLAPAVDAGGLRVESGELVHDNPRKVVDGGAEYSFLLTAKYGEPITLYAAGNAANDDGQTSGDRASTTSLQILVDGPERPPPPPPPPAPSPAPRPSAPAPAPAPAPDSADAATDAGTAPPPSSDGGCALGMLGASSGASSGSASAGAGALLLGLLVTRAVRRRRPARK
jgi:hypothetical protein